MTHTKKLLKISLWMLFFCFNTVFPQCFSKASAGYYHSAGIKPNGSIWGWGSGINGQLNNGDQMDEYSPVLLSNQNDWQWVKSFYETTFAIKQNGTLWACGYNVYGELGINSTATGSPILVQVGTDTNWKDVASSESQTIGIKTDNTLWGWGLNNEGEVGNNSCCVNVLAPVLISSATDWKKIGVSGIGSSFALKNNGTLWGWGSNVCNLLNPYNNLSLNVPTQINTDTDWKDFCVGNAHILVLKNNGTLWAWGNGGFGETGHDPNTSFGLGTPNQIPGTNWSKMAVGYFFSLAIKTDGTLWAWGRNNIGQLGDGTTIDRYIPIQIGTDSDWDSISAEYQHVIALKNNGALYSWGQNDYGQLGNGTTNPVATPTVIPIAGCNLANAQFQTSENQCTISPNPAQNELNIFYKGFDFINTVLIYDNSGKIVFSTQPVITKSLSASFSIANLQAGQYIVVLKNNNKTIISKQLIKI